MTEQEPNEENAGETTFGVRGEYITLGQLLKMIGAISTGGEAKYFLTGNSVLVNDEAEERRGRKLRVGDQVIIPGEGVYRMVQEPAP